MNRKLKTLIIVIVAIVAIIGIGAGGYFLINNLSKTTVSNFRIVDAEGHPINDKSVYLVSSSNNNFDISVQVEASGPNHVYFSSSNPDVAKVFVRNGKYFVQYYKVGETTITATSAEAETVSDSFKLVVNENFIDNIVIQGNSDNIVTMYADGTTAEYEYSATGVVSDVECNNSLIRVVNNYDTSIFKSISINSANQTLTVESNLVTTDSVQTLTLQTYSVDENGVEHINKNFIYTVNVIGYRISDIELIISQDYTFKNKYTYLSELDIGETRAARPKDLTDETIVDGIYLTDDVDKIYFRTRVIYTNGTYKDLSPVTDSISTEVDANRYISKYTGNTNGMDYWLSVDKDNVASVSETVFPIIVIGYTDTSINYNAQKSFELTYLVESSAESSTYYKFFNNKLYKKYVEEGKTYYEYIFWDTRYRRTDTITDAAGRIVGFTSNEPACQG